LFADNQVGTANTEDNIQRAVYGLSTVAAEYDNLALENKSNNFQRRTKVAIGNKMIEHVMQFKYLGTLRVTV
jgi:hypothetical protein